MSDERVKVGYVMAANVREKLRRLAELERRSMGAQLEWLVEQAWAQRGLTLTAEQLDALFTQAAGL